MLRHEGREEPALERSCVVLNLTVEVVGRPERGSAMEMEERLDGGVQCSTVSVKFWKENEGNGQGEMEIVRLVDVVRVWLVVPGPDLMVIED